MMTRVMSQPLRSLLLGSPRIRITGLLIATLAAISLHGLLPIPSAGHARSVSYSGWRLDDQGGTVRVRVSLLELSRLGLPLPLSETGTDPSTTDAIGLYLADHLELRSGDAPCLTEDTPQALPSETGWLVYRWRVRCPSSDERSIRSNILLKNAPSHMHFARLTVPQASGGSPRITERVLTEADPVWRLTSTNQETPSPATGTTLIDYTTLGIEHILSGWDHLAFVLALLLIARSLGEVARLVTGFTVAHSITLALAVLGWVQPASSAIEAVIGFSVALIAAENIWLISGRGWFIPGFTTAALLVAGAVALLGFGNLPALALFGLALFTASHFGLLQRARDPGLIRVLLAFAFGLVHGFGFAGVLGEMNLPTHRLAPALLGFNVGVELGQLAVVALLWPLLMGLRSLAQGRPHRRFTEWAGAAICGIGLFWFVTRTYT